MTAVAHLPSIVVRAAEEADLPEVIAIERVSFNDPWTPEAFRTAISLAHGRFLVARAGSAERGREGRLLGYVLALMLVDEGEIADLAVAPDHRRQGIGGLLLDRVLGDAAERGIRAIFLEVRGSNLAARGLYESRDFREVGRRPRYYRHPEEDALVLRRDPAPC